MRAIFVRPLDGARTSIQTVEVMKTLLAPALQKPSRSAPDIKDLAVRADPILEKFIGQIKPIMRLVPIPRIFRILVF